MEQKKYPIGLPVRCKDKVTRIIKEPSESSIGCYMCIDPTNGYGEIIYQTWLTTLTEAEYFAEVMQPQGWKVSGNEQYFANEETELFIHRSPNYTVQHKYHINAFTRHMLGTISEALDHSEALQAISKYENS